MPFEVLSGVLRHFDAIMCIEPIEYPFPADPAATDYSVFPQDLENSPHVFFHGTADACRIAILNQGFRIPQPPLPQSVSFARTSALSLKYASDARSPASPAGCIFAVHYEVLHRKGLVVEPFMLHDYTLDPPPTIIGYCIIPPHYLHW